MKKRIFSMILALVMTMGLGAAAFAAAEEPEPTPEPEYRLASISEHYAEENWAEYTYTFSYDESGYLPTSFQQTEAGYAPYITTLGYDDAGRIISARVEPSDSHDTYDEYRYTYDEDGNLIKKENEHYFHGYPVDANGNLMDEVDASSFVVTEYTYDEDGAFLSAEKTTTDYYGNVATEESDPEFLQSEFRDFRYSEIYPTPFIGAGYNSDFGSLDIWLDDSVGRTIFTSGIGNGVLAAEPELTYDDNGYLIKADDGAGNYVELTYEPVV